jgi:hypothetical protein
LAGSPQFVYALGELRRIAEKKLMDARQQPPSKKRAEESDFVYPVETLEDAAFKIKVGLHYVLEFVIILL